MKASFPPALEAAVASQQDRDVQNTDSGPGKGFFAQIRPNTASPDHSSAVLRVGMLADDVSSGLAGEMPLPYASRKRLPVLPRHTRL